MRNPTSYFRDGGWIDGLLVVFVGGLLTLFAIGLLAFMFYLADSVGIPARRTSATVTGTVYHSETTTITYIGDVMQVNTIPASWDAYVTTKEGDRLGCDISKAQFSVLFKGATVNVDVGQGRFSGATYCTGMAN